MTQNFYELTKRTYTRGDISEIGNKLGKKLDELEKRISDLGNEKLDLEKKIEMLDRRHLEKERDWRQEQV